MGHAARRDSFGGPTRRRTLQTQTKCQRPPLHAPSRGIQETFFLIPQGGRFGRCGSVHVDSIIAEVSLTPSGRSACTRRLRLLRQALAGRIDVELAECLGLALANHQVPLAPFMIESVAGS